MLILSRKSKESLILECPDGQKIEILVTEISSGQVKLGIQAPESCQIWRKELRQTIEHNRQAAAGTPASALRGLAAKLK